MSTFEIILAVAAVAISAVGVPPLRTRLRARGRVDVPNDRTSHVGEIPRGAGLVVAVGVAATGTLWLVLEAEDDRLAVAAVVFGSAMLGLVGLLDDRRDLGPIVRLGAQVAVAAAIAVATIDGTVGAGRIVAGAVAVVAVVGYVNAFNFMDGINGISGLQAVLAGVFFAALGLNEDLPHVAAMGALVAAGFVGFLPYNFPSASVFLGDVGSYFGGCWLAGCAALSVQAGVPVAVAIAPGLLYLVDTATTLLRRLLGGRPVLEAHREHAYQRLAVALGSHVPVTFAAGFAIAVASAAALAAVDGGGGAQSVAFAIGVVTAAGFVASPDVLGALPGGWSPDV